MVKKSGIDPQLLEISEYVRSLNPRLASLNEVSEASSKHIANLDISVVSKRNIIQEQLSDAKKEVCILNDDIRDLQKAILNMITCLKSSVKAEDCTRFKSRLELWGPEKLVSRQEAKKALKKENII